MYQWLTMQNKDQHFFGVNLCIMAIENKCMFWKKNSKFKRYFFEMKILLNFQNQKIEKKNLNKHKNKL